MIARAPRVRIFFVCALSLAGSVLLYGRTLTYGFDWDDYHFMRSYTLTEVGRAWSGPWDARDHLEAPFYRPVTIVFYAGRAWLFGLHPMALHALSVLLFAMAASVLILWLCRLELSRPAVLAGALVFLTHPVMPASAVAWVTNQMHLLELLLVMSALSLATDGPRRWPWLVVLQIVTALVKEDGIMLGPAVAAVWIVRGISLPRRWIFASAAVVLIYLPLRTWALGGIGGFEGASLMRNAVYGPLNVLRLVDGSLNSADRFATLALLAIGSFAVWHVWRVRWLAVQPLVLAATLLGLFNAPLIFASGPTRSQLLVVCLAVGVAGAVQLLEHTRQRVTSLVLVAVVVLAFAVSNWAAVNRFAPCAADVLSHDHAVRAWGDAVPLALRDELARKVCP